MKDSLEITVSPADYLLHSPEVREQIDKYSYRDERGQRIISWDFAKYVNHCCNCNTISTGYGFEVALREIEAGEQITDEYGIFNIEREMSLVCDQPGCRQCLRPSDFDAYYEQWDRRIREVLPLLKRVSQPLLPFIDPQAKRDLRAYFADDRQYKSVYVLKFRPERLPELNGTTHLD